LIALSCKRAARGGTDTVWWFGDDAAAMATMDNVYDESARAVGFRGQEPEPKRDGFVIHAPVGCNAPNPYGLYDVHGNVIEWCLDVAESHKNQPHRRGDGLLLAVTPPGGRHALRGGNFGYNASWGRSAYRVYANGSDNYWGLRAVRAVLPR